MKRHGAWSYGVHRTCAETTAVPCGTSHASAVSTPFGVKSTIKSCRTTCKRGKSARESYISIHHSNQIKVPSVEDPELTDVLPLKPGVGPTVDRHDSPADRNFFLILVPNSQFHFLLFNPFVASSARKGYIRKPTLPLRTSCTGALHCRSLPTCSFISRMRAPDSRSDCTAPKQSCNRT